MVLLLLLPLMNILVLLLLIINDNDDAVADADDDVNDDQYNIFSIKDLFTKVCNSIFKQKLAQKKPKKNPLHFPHYFLVRDISSM